MLLATVPFAVLIVGLLLWALAANPIVKDVGRLMFAVGLLWSVYAVVGHTVKLFG